MTLVPFAASLRSDIVLLLTGVAWPVLIGVILWRLSPTVRTIMESRGFTVKAAGAEITVEAGGNQLTVQQASDQMHDKVEDLREQVSALKLQVGATGADPSPITDGLPHLRSVLWVDDHPENNAYETKALVDKGVDVVQARSTAEALTCVRTHRAFDVVISDMGRTEEGVDKTDAGLDLVRRLKDEGVEAPILIYASAAAVARSGAKAREAGACAATSSATELLDLLGRVGARSAPAHVDRVTTAAMTMTPGAPTG